MQKTLLEKITSLETAATEKKERYKKAHSSFLESLNHLSSIHAEKQKEEHFITTYQKDLRDLAEKEQSITHKISLKEKEQDIGEECPVKNGNQVVGEFGIKDDQQER